MRIRHRGYLIPLRAACNFERVADENESDVTPLGSEEGAVEETAPAAHYELSPRHRRFAQLLAGGATGAQIAQEIGYTDAWQSTLKKNPAIMAEVRRLQDRLFEETIQKRLKEFADPALANIQYILTDKTNRVKVSEKADMSKWVVEKLDGKAVQKTDIGENLLGVMLDRLDALKNSGGSALPAPRDVSLSHTQNAEVPKPKSEEDLLSDWVVDFTDENK